MASDISESKQYAIDDDISNEVVEVTEIDGALLWDLLEELEEEEEEEISKNNNNPKEAAADHNIIEGNNCNIVSDNFGHAFVKQEDNDDHEYSKGVDLMEISNNSSLLLPSSDEEGGAWYTDDDDMVGIVDYYCGCNNIIGDYSHYCYYHLYNNHGAATANSYTTTDQITYSLWEGC